MEVLQPSILRLIKRSDSSGQLSFEHLFLHHMDSLYRTALRMAKNRADAEDLVQDTLFKAYKYFNQLHDYAKARAWLFQILVNTFYNRRKQLKREPAIVDVDLTEDLVSSSEVSPHYDPLEVFSSLMSDEVVDALDHLHPDFKLVLLLYDVEGLSYDEIAEVCDCSKGTVASRLYRAREILRITLEEYARQRGYL